MRSVSFLRSLAVAALVPALAAALGCPSELPVEPPTEVEDPGRVTLHRLNRAEYDNTVRDLLLTELRPAQDFPPDDFGEGFDNIADVLSLSPLHLEVYELAADRLIEDVLTVTVAEQLWHVEAESEDAVATVGGQHSIGWNLWSGGDLQATATLPEEGTYRVSARVFGQQAGDELARAALLVDNVEVFTTDVAATSAEPEVIEVVTTIEAGTRAFGVGFLNDFYDPDAGLDRNLVVDWIALEGPLGATSEPHPGRSLLLPCDPTDGEDACARAALETFTPRAWRRPVTTAEIDALFALYALSRETGGEFAEGLQLAAKTALLSPHFIFRVERDPSPTDVTPHPLDPYELASRISYFLWSSMPDAELFAAAADGSLLQDDVLEAQVRRMLADPKAEALVDNLGGQWLLIRAVDDVTPFYEAFPTFDETLRASMKEQMRRVVGDVLLDDRSMLELLTAETTRIDARLATHYGVEAPEADWDEIALTDSGPRRGILGTAGLLTALSYPTRTSPVKRGQWILEALTCSAPPPPPAGVEGLPTEGNTDAPLREQLEQHRADPLCNSCHEVMDQLGFALESFDGVGAYRTEDDGGFPIDASGVLPGGQSFDHAGELADLLAADRRVPRCVVHKVFTYALGRAPVPTDLPFLEGVEQRFVDTDHRFADLAVGIVLSAPFRNRRGEAPQ